jgi:two-component system, NtrC family, response regulator PilR
MASILIVEDEPDLRSLLTLSIIKMGHKVIEAENIANALRYIEKYRQNSSNSIDLTITDMRLPDGLGSDIVKICCTQNIPVVVMTAYGSTDAAIEALKMGAVDYLTKPVPLDILRNRIGEILDKHQQNANFNHSAHTNPEEQSIDDWIIGKSSNMQALKQRILQYANSLAPVMIMGESGSGKERVAKAIHMYSKRKGTFVAVNCGAIPENLMESEFFGVAKGAYTGAHQARIGLFEEAKQGTLFLDEIAELPLNMQTKLLRALQERRIRPLGSTQELNIDVRIICATHQDMEFMLKQERFRHDLYYRIHVLPLYIPNLNARKEDIPILVDTILKQLNKNYQRNKSISLLALNKLEQHHYTGNIRELENLLEAAYALNQNIIEDIQLNKANAHSLNKNKVEDYAKITSTNEKVNIEHNQYIQDCNLPLLLEDIERKYIMNALKEHKNNQSAAAKALNLSLRQLRYRLERLGIDIV